MSATKTLLTRAVQMTVRPGHPAHNVAQMLDAIATAKTDGVELLVFPEMAVPGYLIADEWERDAFLRECEACGDEIRAASDGLVVVFGNIGIDRERRNEDGRVRKYNACFVAEDGAFLRGVGGRYDFAIKALLPNYREFDDSRYFYDLRKLALEEGQRPEDLLTPIQTRDLSLGCILCEDAWDADYGFSPWAVLAAQNVDLLINISCSPFTANKNHKRNRVFSAHAEECRTPLIYVNNVGLQDNGKTVYTFDGSSCIYDGHGNQVTAGEPFTAATLTHAIPLDKSSAFGEPVKFVDDGSASLYRALTYGTRLFMERCGVERIVVGISGGIDSAVVASLYSSILAPENLLLVNMPSRYNSATTRSLAKTLADNIGCFFAEIPIEDSVQVTTGQVDGLQIESGDGRQRQTLKLSDFVLENVQARDRSSRVLAALAAAFGGVFTCNANKSEATVGYTTLYGDLAGYLANIADLWKTEVIDLARYMNDAIFGEERIPQGSLDIVPSAELSAAQNVDEGRGDPLVYAYHDRIFASWVEWWNRTTPEDLLAWYIDGSLEERLDYAGAVRDLFDDDAAFVADLERWWNLYQGMALAKRIQAPPILAVKRRAFGFDHRESQLGPRYTRQYASLKARLLGDG